MIAGALVTERGNVFYWVAHPKPADFSCLVLTHGITADHTLFDKQVEFLQDRYNLIVWDVPLNGLSRPYTDYTSAHGLTSLCHLL